MMTRQSPRYRVVSLSDHVCELTHYVDEHGDREDHELEPVEPRTRTYWAPGSGGYVRDTTDQDGTLGQQVCDALAGVGSTLMWYPGGADLAETIRHEARALYRSMDREAAQYRT